MNSLTNLKALFASLEGKRRGGFGKKKEGTRRKNGVLGKEDFGGFNFLHGTKSP